MILDQVTGGRTYGYDEPLYTHDGANSGKVWCEAEVFFHLRILRGASRRLLTADGAQSVSTSI